MKPREMWGGVLGLLSLSAEAAESPARHTVLMVQPQVLESGLLGLGVERSLGAWVALSGAVRGVAGLDGWSLSPEEPTLYIRRWGVAADVGAHVYLAGRAPEGFWVGPHVEGALEHYTSDTLEFSPSEVRRGQGGWRSHSLGGGARAGYTTVLASGLSAQVGLGLAALRETSRTFNPAPEGGDLQEVASVRWSVFPRMTVGLGWAF
jgi:hypothetical protein